MQAKTEESVTADYGGGGNGWGDDDPSVFVMKTVGHMEGEFQVTNGYGPEKAVQVMKVRQDIYVNNFIFIVLTNSLLFNHVEISRLPITDKSSCQLSQTQLPVFAMYPIQQCQPPLFAFDFSFRFDQLAAYFSSYLTFNAYY